MSKVIDEFVSIRSEDSDRDKLYEIAELNYCLKNEMIYYLSDLLIRRTAKIFFDRENSEKHIQYLNGLLSRQLKLNENSSQKMLLAAKEEYQSAVTFK